MNPLDQTETLAVSLQYLGTGYAFSTIAHRMILGMSDARDEKYMQNIVG